MRFALSILLVSVFTIAANAQKEDVLPPEETPTQASVVALLPSMEDLNAISPESRALYIKGLQKLFVEIEDLEMSQGGTYAKAANTSSRAPASTDSLPCLYAGWILQTDPSTGKCERPDNKKRDGKACGPNQVACNPLLYGDACASVGVRATYNCIQRSAPVAKIVSDWKVLLKKDPNVWNELKANISAYCKNGKQLEVCRLVQKRVSRLNAQVTKTEIEKQSTRAAGTGDAETGATKAPSVVKIANPSQWLKNLEPKLCKASDLISPQNGKSLGLNFRQTYQLLCTMDSIRTPKLTARINELEVRFKKYGNEEDGKEFARMSNCMRDVVSAKERTLGPHSWMTAREYFDPQTKKHVINVEGTEDKSRIRSPYTGTSQLAVETKLAKDIEANGNSICDVRPGNLAPENLNPKNPTSGAKAAN